MTETTGHVLIEDRTARHDLYVAAADYIGDGEEADALLDGHADDVRRERDEQIIALLCKKAREYGTAPHGARHANKDDKLRADVLYKIADKIGRGAVRPDNLT